MLDEFVNDIIYVLMHVHAGMSMLILCFNVYQVPRIMKMLDYFMSFLGHTEMMALLPYKTQSQPMCCFFTHVLKFCISEPSIYY